MERVGVDVSQMQQLKSALDRSSESVNQLSTEIGGQLGNTYWEGPAATRFKGDWESKFAPMLRDMQTQLQEAGTEVANRASRMQEAGS
jgi:WXG100 family type VII secretion target